MLNSEQNPEVCDATDDDSSTAAGLKNVVYPPKKYQIVTTKNYSLVGIFLEDLPR